jgi:ABC-2 type transport system permease protein
MATSSSLPQVLVQPAAPDMLQRVAPGRALRGFGNLLGNETRAWWGTRKWLVHLVIWIAIINGFTGLIAWAEGQDGEAASEVYSEAVQVFFIIGGIAAALGVVSTTQGAIVGEKQLGTAAWIMSKPVSRSAFVLAKLLAHAGAFLVLAVAIPALVFCIQSLIAGWGLPPLVPFAGGLAVLALHLLFYLALTIMLGTVFSARGPIVGIGVGLIIAGQLLPNLLPQLSTFFPWRLPWAAGGLVLGEVVSREAFVAMGMTAAWTGLFVGVALWRFAREEF